MAEGDAKLDDDQAAVYDRQLRVWGVEVQQKCVARLPADARVRAEAHRSALTPGPFHNAPTQNTGSTPRAS